MATQDVFVEDGLLKGVSTGVGDDAKIETGKYTGDGTTSQVISLTDDSLTPKYVLVWNNQTADNTSLDCVCFTTDDYVDEHASGLTVSLKSLKSYHNKIIAMGIGSFTVDDNAADEHPNANGVVYQYLAIGT